MTRSAWQTIAAGILILGCAGSARAIEGTQVMLDGGSDPTIPLHTIGGFDLHAPEALVFRAAGQEITMPYAAITEVDSRSDVARHLGVLPAVAVSLVRKRERRHTISLTYDDAAHVRQSVLFEVPKDMPPTLLALLRARAPQACGPHGALCRAEREH